MNNNLQKKIINSKKKLSRKLKFKKIERLVKLNRVYKVTKGGKKLSFQAIMVVGDQKGQVGVGIAKANDVINVFKKAKRDGWKNIIKIPLTKSLTIPHNTNGNFGACQVILRPASEGSGVIAGGAVRIVLETAGIRNIIAKQLGSNNLLNNARASICALKKLTTRRKVINKRSFGLN